MRQKKGKVLSLFACFLFMASAYVQAQSITVTSPVAGAQCCLGKPIAITWTKIGNLDPLAHLRLRDQTGNTLILDIVKGIPNSGSYTWTIPSSVAPGNYIIRVRTSPDGVNDGPVYADSAVFTIKQCGLSTQQDRDITLPKIPDNTTIGGPPLQKVDFEMLDVERETGSGVIFAKLKNNGSGPYNGPLTFRVMFGNDVLDPMTVPVNLAAGATQMINLMYYLQPREMVVRNTVVIKVKADSDNKVVELSEQNNEFSRTVTRLCPIYVDRLEYEVTPSQSSGPYPFLVKIVVRLWTVGQGQLVIKYEEPGGGYEIYQCTITGPGEHVYNAELYVRGPIFVVKPRTLFAYVENPCVDGGVRKSNPVEICCGW